MEDNAIPYEVVKEQDQWHLVLGSVTRYGRLLDIRRPSYATTIMTMNDKKKDEDGEMLM